MTFKAALLGAVATLLVVADVTADDHGRQGWYVGIGAGFNWIHDGVQQDLVGGTLLRTQAWSFDTGSVVAGTLGHYYGGGWRFEFELARRDNDVDTICAVACVGSTAEVNQFSQMFNAIYEVPVAKDWTLSLGAGLGGNLVELDNYLGASDRDYVLALQGLAQVGYSVTERWTVFADYRYMKNGDVQVTVPGGDLELEKADSSLMLGVRFDLQPGAAPVQARVEPQTSRPVATTPAAPKEFLVFFGFNKSDLTSHGVRVVGEAAEAAKKHGAASISIVGHTDTSGSAVYNNALSMRRAQAVKDSLMAHGIDGGMISTAGRGEAELLVTTGDGVKEPQNRRAKIDVN
jgi:OOP family OmpA-OmpF porin